jgi:leucine dehydrogenase
MKLSSKLKIIDIPDYEKVIRIEDPSVGLVGFIAIHHTGLGPALGGTRLWNYKDEAAALNDALRLARGMTYKAAGASLPLGGGKAVLIGDAKTIKSPEYFKAYGRIVDELKGMYITAEDINITTDDIRYIAETTPYVVGRSGKSGNPSPFTALGVFYGILASIKWLKLKTIQHLSFAIQGVGETGYRLLKLLLDAGAKKIYFTEINPDHIRYVQTHFPQAILVPEHEFYQLDVDVLVPCALGGILNETTIPHIHAKLIAGTANNILLDEKVHGPMLQARGILVAPDFMINAGGLINVYHELKSDYHEEEVKQEIMLIGSRLVTVYEHARQNKTYPFFEAMRFSELTLNRS